MPEQLITVRQADSTFARYLATTGTQTRAALDALLPKGTGAIPSTSVAQIVRQRSDGTWINPVRDSNVSGRIHVATVDTGKTPRIGDGVQGGDVLIGAGVYVATVTSTTVTWVPVAVSTGGGTTTPPVDTTNPGTGTTPTTPPTGGDTSTPSPTSRPHALLGSLGTWMTSTGKTVTQALADQAASTASATPDPVTGGVSLTLDMSNFSHQVGNDLTVTLWGAATTQPGDVTVVVGFGGKQYVSPKSLTLESTTTAPTTGKSFSGQTLSGTIQSTRMGGARPKWICATPNGVPKGLVVFLHGRGGYAQREFDELPLVAEAKRTGMAIVAVDGGDEYWFAHDSIDAGAMVMDELLPALAGQGLPTERIGITGYSMGGCGTLLMAERYGSARIVAAAPMSSAVWEDWHPDPEGAAQKQVRRDVGKLSGVPVRMTCGTEDGLFGVNKTMAALIPNVQTEWTPGDHEFPYWRKALPGQLDFIAARFPNATAPQQPAGPVNLAFTWPADAQLSLPVEVWRDVEVTVTRRTGGFSTLADLTLQSTPRAVNPGPVDTTDPASLVWASKSVWTSQVGTAPVARASAAVVAYIRSQVGSGALRMDCLPGGDAAPIWMVPASTPRTNVSPPATSSRGTVALMHTTDGKGALDGVPLPSTMPAPGNMFGTAVIACLETKQVWELLGLTKSGTTWSAEWGGRIDDTTSNGGVFPTDTGYTGSGLAWAAAAVKVSEAKAAAAGQVTAIQHVLGLNLNYDSASSSFCWPATRSDGTSTDPGAPKMGQRVRLKAGFNVDASNLTPLGKAVAKALQTYGAVILGGAARPSIVCESGQVEQTRTGVDPWGEVLGGKSIDTVLAGLPLDQLEAVSPGWGGPGWVVETDQTTTNPTTPTTPTNPTTPSTGSAAMRLLGPSRSGLPWHSGVKADGPYTTAMVEKFGQWRGRPVDGGITYPEYADQSTRKNIIDSGWCATLYNGFPGRIYYGMAPFPSNPFYADKNPDARLWGRLANGEFDDVIDGQASFLANNGRGNSVIRVAWEWNGDWYSWHAGYAGVDRFKAGFRRIVQRFRTKSNDFKFVFEVNAGTVLKGSSGLTALTSAYPGDDVVDIVGIDCYQFRGEGSPDGNFERYLRSGGSRGPMLDDVADFARQHGKGLGVFEWGVHGTDGYGDRPDYIEGMWNWFVKNRDILVAESYFNEAEDYIKCSLYNSQTGALQNPKAAAKYKELWSRGVV